MFDKNEKSNIICAEVTKMIDYKEIINVINESKSNDEIVEALYSYVKNPIAITDNNYRLISYFPHNRSVDFIFNEATKKGYWPLEVVSLVNKKLDKKVPYQIITINNNRRLMFNILFNDIHLGYCAILEQEVPIEEINIELCLIFVNFLARELYSIKPHLISISNSQFLEDALSNNYINRKIFLDRLSNTTIKIEESYKISLISLEYFKYRAYGELNNVVDSLFKNCTKALKDDYLIVLFNEHNCDFSSINSIFGNFKIFGITSSPIKDLYNLNNYYETLKNLLVYIKQSQMEYKMFYENDFKEFIPLTYITNKKILYNSIKEEILILDRFDQDNNSELCKTLYVYLSNNKSLVHTSNHLFLHKNTITYRLGKIKELINNDLSNNYTNMSFVLSLKILYYLKINNL